MTDQTTPSSPPPRPATEPDPAVSALAPLPFAEERERAIRLLTDRYADDTITEAELERRLDRLNAAGASASVDAVVADLLVAAPLADAAMEAFSPSVPEERRIVAVMSEHTARDDGRCRACSKFARS